MLTEQYFLSAAEVDILKKAIESAERNTSGEIRVYFEKSCNTDALQRATYLFHELNMHQTALRNAVLIYIAYQSHHFAIVGDEAIHAVVQQKFWDEMNELALTHFKRNEYVLGLENVIHRLGMELKKYFPYQDDDINELSDDIIIQ
jgi:uncharacterized membrane protein